MTTTGPFDAYDRARLAVVAAQQDLADTFAAHGVRPEPEADGDPAQVAEARDALARAHAALQAEADAHADAVQAAWQANRRAVEDAKDAVAAAMQERKRVETAASKAAAARHAAQGGQGPVRLTDDEAARCWAARDAWLTAKDDLMVAQERFKSGVTGEQLTAANGTA